MGRSKPQPTTHTTTLSQEVAIAAGHAQAGRLDAAEAILRKALRSAPNDVAALNLLSIVEYKSGRAEAAVTAAERALKLSPGAASAHANLAVMYRKLGNANKAIEHGRRAVELKPDFADAHYNLGLALFDVRDCATAIRHYDEAIALDPRLAEAFNNRGVTLHWLKRFAEAELEYRRALAIRPSYPEAFNNLGSALRDQGRLEDAVQSYQKAIEHRPLYLDALKSLGHALNVLGRFDEARSAFDRVLTLDPQNAEAHLAIAYTKTFRATDDPHLRAIEGLDFTTLAPEHRAPLHFALGKAYDDLARFDEAFVQFASGNGLRRATIDGGEADNALIECTRARIGADMIRSRSGNGVASVRPIFILGMPRSGTTLVEQILASHPMVSTIGEANELNAVIGAAGRRIGSDAPYPQFLESLTGPELAAIAEDYLAALDLRQPAAARIVDKTPDNFFFVGLIHLVLPNARIIHVTRDPLDTCLSCFSKSFAGWNQTYDLAELGRFYRLYQKLMHHWRTVLPPDAFLDVSYEALVSDPEVSTKRILDYCGLAWDDAVRNFHTHNRAIKTASLVQARQPIYSGSIGRWRNYRKHLTPLIAELFATTG